ISAQSDSAFLANALNPKRYKVASLRIEGADNSDKNVIALLSGLAEGEEITVPGEKTSEAIKKLWRQGMFENVQIIQDKVEGDRIHLVIKVVERPRLTKFSFKGQVKRSEADDLRS